MLELLNSSQPVHSSVDSLVYDTLQDKQGPEGLTGSFTGQTRARKIGWHEDCGAQGDLRGVPGIKIKLKANHTVHRLSDCQTDCYLRDRSQV